MQTIEQLTGNNRWKICDRYPTDRLEPQGKINKNNCWQNKYPNKKPGKDISKLEVQKIRIYILYFLNPKRDIRELKLFQLFQFVSP